MYGDMNFVLTRFVYQLASDVLATVDRNIATMTDDESEALAPVLLQAVMELRYALLADETGDT